MVNCDIRVAAIYFIAPLLKAPCPVEVLVKMKNVGPGHPITNNPTDTFDVCLESAAFEVEGGTYREKVELKVDQPILGPNESFPVRFRNVTFNQGGRVRVTATADCSSNITNNSRTDPSMVLPVHVIAVSWLETKQVQVGLTDRDGVPTVPVSSICPGQPFWVQATIENLGVADAPPSTATLTISDSFGHVLDTVDSPVPSINAQLSQGVIFHSPGLAQTPVQGSNQSLIALVTADSKNVVPQCDRTRCSAQVSVALPQSGPTAPIVTFSVASLDTILPGMPVPVNWAVQNVTAK